MVEAVYRLYVEALHPAVLPHIQGNAWARAPLRPDLAVKVGQILRLFAIDADDDIAAFDARLLRRTIRRHPADEQPPAQLIGVETKPRPPGSGLAPGRDQVAEDRRQPVD